MQANLINSQIRAKAHCHWVSINPRLKSGVKESSDPQRTLVLISEICELFRLIASIIKTTIFEKKY